MTTEKSFMKWNFLQNQTFSEQFSVTYICCICFCFYSSLSFMLLLSHRLYLKVYGMEQICEKLKKWIFSLTCSPPPPAVYGRWRSRCPKPFSHWGGPGTPEGGGPSPPSDGGSRPPVCPRCPGSCQSHCQTGPPFHASASAELHSEKHNSTSPPFSHKYHYMTDWYRKSTGGSWPHRVLHSINFTGEGLNLPPGLIGLLLGLPQRVSVALGRLSQIHKLRTQDEIHWNECVFLCSCVIICLFGYLPTLDWYQSSDSCMFFEAMVSYWALISLRAPVKSGLMLLSTSIFSCWVWTLTWTSWISWW